MTALTAFIVTYLIEKTVGVRVSHEQEVRGLDQSIWGASEAPLRNAIGFLPATEAA